MHDCLATLSFHLVLVPSLKFLCMEVVFNEDISTDTLPPPLEQFL